MKRLILLKFIFLFICLFSIFGNQDTTKIGNVKSFGSFDAGMSYSGNNLFGVHSSISFIKKYCLFADFSGNFFNNSMKMLDVTMYIGKPIIFHKQTYFAFSTGLGIVSQQGYRSPRSIGSLVIPFQFRLHFTTKIIGLGIKMNSYLPLESGSKGSGSLNAYFSVPFSSKK